MSVAEVPPDIGALATPPLLGYMLNWGLFGVLAVQTYNYYLAFPRDRLYVKSLVYGLFVLETLQTILNSHDVYKMYGAGFGNLDALEALHLSWFTVPILSGIVSAFVQSFYAHRIWILSKSNALAIVVTLIALMQGAAGIATGVVGHEFGAFSQLQRGIYIPCTIWLVGSAACDIIIAVCMTYLLSKADTGFKATRLLIAKLIRLTIETGTVTASVAIIDVVFFLIPNNLYHITAAMCLGKLYSNAMLVMLNSRTGFIGGRDEGASTIQTFSDRFRIDDAPGLGSSAHTLQDITIQRDVWTRTDDIEMKPTQESNKSGTPFIHVLK